MKPLYASGLKIVSPSKITQYAGSLYVPPKDERLHYTHAQREGILPVLIELSRKQSIRSEFNFILDFFTVFLPSGGLPLGLDFQI